MLADYAPEEYAYELEQEHHVARAEQRNLGRTGWNYKIVAAKHNV